MNRKKLILTVILLTVSSVAICQLEGANWIFGDSTGLSFVSGSPIAFQSVNGSALGTSTISDKNGNLLFYGGVPGSNIPPSGGQNDLFAIFDSTHQMILNGDNIYCNDAITQGSIFIPAIGDSNLVYLFHIGGPPIRLRYTLLDKRLNNGQGAVVFKNVAVDNLGCGTLMQAVKHANGRDWWIITHRGFQSNSGFNLYLLDPNGVFYHSTEFTSDPLSSNGFMIASPDGQRIVVSDAYYNELEVYDFDRCTGNITFTHELETRTNNPTGYNGQFGCSFSSNSNVLYASTHSTLFQWDLLSPNVDSSKQIIYQTQDSVILSDSAQFGGHLIGLDEKIYIVSNTLDLLNSNYHGNFHTFNMNLNVIENPNSLGLNCNFQPLGIHLNGRRSILGFPTIANFSLGAETGSVCDSLAIGITELKHKFDFAVFPNPNSGVFNIQYLLPQSESGILELFNMKGQIVFSQFLKHKSTIHSISTSNILAGIYNCAITLNRNTINKKIVIVH